MAELIRSSTFEEEDPLNAFSGLSLFPRTLKSLSIPLPPPPPHQSQDLQQTHTLLQSMPFEIRKEHQEQAKAILDVSSELLKQGNGASVASEDTNVGVKMNPMANKRERRPGLDRKQRGQFTFKATTSELPQNKPTFDGTKYPKPEDFFAAHEKYQNALREWQKQTGTVELDTNQNQRSRLPRRPGIPGRKRGSYKHTYTDSSYLTDLKASEKENSIPSEQNLEKTTTAHVPTVDREVDDSALTDKDLENVLANLLACSPDELEGDAGVKLLEKSLHIKPIDKKVFSLPEFPDIKRMDMKSSRRSPSNRGTALSNIQNLLNRNNSYATRKNSQSSSPNPPEDQFSFPDRHNLLPGDLQSREVDLAKDLNVCFRSSVANDADKVTTNESPSNVGVCIASSFNDSVQKSSDEVESNTQSGIHRSHSSLDENADNCEENSITERNAAAIKVNVDMKTKGNVVDVSMSESKANGNTGTRENEADIEETTNLLDSLEEQASREDVRMDPFTSEKDDGIPYQQDESSKSPNRAPEQYNTMGESFEHTEHIQGKHGEENDNTDTACEPQDVHNSSEKQTSRRRKRGTFDSGQKKRIKTVHDDSEREKQMKTLSHESGAKKQTKRKPKEQDEKKQKKTVTREGKRFSRRKSLEGAGTKWESGVRRSTRIKSRPLDYWRGEKFLLGRIHESLTTVIGIKYASPDKGRNEKPVLKVKSFVSDDYKELIDLAALH